MRNILRCLLICLVSLNATAQTKKLSKKTILKDGTVLKYVIGKTYKIKGSFGTKKYSDDGDILDTLTIKIKTIDNKLKIILNNDTTKAFELSKDQTPDYFFFQAYEKVNYFDLLLSEDMISKSTITTYNNETEKPIKSNYYNHQTISIIYNGKKQSISTKLFKSEKVNEYNMYFVYSFNNDNQFPLLTKEYFILDKDTYEGLYCKLISIETK
ncbi:MAG TPA: hypothetical protein ENK67_01560 [Flavobacteriia bacterium]|nr:hypothetical protein [Flavobacteriia bacterium]